MIVVAIGDSITAGQYLPEGELAWPALIERFDVVAAGVSNDTTRLGLERFPREVQEREPDAVIIQFGHNDCNRWQTDRWLPRVSRLAYEANMIEMVDRCRQFDAAPFICTLTPSHKSETHATDVRSYNAALGRVWEQTNVSVIDVRDAFGDGEGLLLDDGLHLNAAGHALYATVVQEALDRWQL